MAKAFWNILLMDLTAAWKFNPCLSWANLKSVFYSNNSYFISCKQNCKHQAKQRTLFVPNKVCEIKVIPQKIQELLNIHIGSNRTIWDIPSQSVYTSTPPEWSPKNACTIGKPIDIGIAGISNWEKVVRNTKPIKQSWQKQDLSD